MANVLKVSTNGDNFVWKDVGTQAEAYLTFEIFVPSATWLAGFIGELALFTMGGDPYTTGVIEDGIRWEDLPPATWDLDSGATVTTAASALDVWHTVSVHWKQVANYPAVFIDGVDYGPASSTTWGDDIDGVLFGAWGGGGGAGDFFYMRNLKIGTTGYGSSDLFSETFAGGTLLAFTSTQGDVSVIADPTGGGGGGGGPSQQVLRLGDPPLWRFIVTNLGSATLTVLDKRASERTLQYELDAPAQHTGLVPSDDPEINIPAPDAISPAFVSHNTRLIYGLRREIRPALGDDPWHCRFAGVIMGLEDVGADTPTSRYTAYDPWKVLFARPIRENDGTLPGADGIVYTDARASDMALDLLTNTVAVDGPVFIDASDAGLREDTDVIPGETVFERGISVGEAWQQLCDTGSIDIVLRPVYDPIDRPGILCELIIAKKAGSVRFNAVMGWDRAGRSLTDLSRLIDGTRLADVVQFYAGQGGEPVTQQIDPTAVAAYGAYWAQQFLVGKQSQQAVVELLALAELLKRRNAPRNIQFAPAPERSYLSLRDYGLGDYVPLWASKNLREPLGIDYDSFDADAPGASGYQRIFVIPIDIDDNGVERVRGLVTSQDSEGTGAAAAAAVGGGGGDSDTYTVSIGGGNVEGDTLTALT